MLEAVFRERRRSRAVRELNEYDSLDAQIFDRFVKAAASAFGAPIAALSLIHGNKQAVKAGYGIPVGCMPRAESFCRFTLDGAGVLECVAPQTDPRFARLPGVLGEPHIRYYVGAPLSLLSGIDVGVLCLVDTVCRKPAKLRKRARRLAVSGLIATD